MTLAKKIKASVVPLLEASGFKKRSGEIFTIDLVEGFIGWLGLNRAKHPQGFELNPVIGIRCQKLEDIVSALLADSPKQYVPPTVSIPLGYLMPESHYRYWLVQESTVINSVADMAAAVDRYGFPFMKSACDLNKINELLESPRFCDAEHAMYRRPVVKWLVGDREAALQMCASFMQQLDERSDPAARNFTQFARGLESLANQIDT